jgi:16S rRNA (uracil1498-N3)-methyltransferase
MKRCWRIHHADLEGVAGGRLRLSPEESHHVRNVLRLERGEALRIFDGKGLEWKAVISEFSKNGVEVELERPFSSSAESPLRVELYQGLCRHDRMELVIQKGTELGIASIHPLRCDRAEIRGVKPVRMERWKRIAIESAKQSGRSVLPGIAQVEELPESLEHDPLALLLTVGAEAEPLGDILARENRRPVRLAVGPESGFSDDETERWAAAGWLRTGLGPRILRTETAGLAAAAIILHLWGDLGSRSG